MKGPIQSDLLIAVRNKVIHCKAWALNSFRETLLYLKNESPNELRVDVSRSGLTAKTGKSQTIGLSHPAESSPGDHIIVLNSGEEREIVFMSRCLDRREKPPMNGIEYKLVPDLLADFVTELLRQGAAQEEVWAITDIRGDEIISWPPIPAMVDKF